MTCFARLLPLLILLLIAPATALRAQDRAAPLAIVGADVLPMTGAARLPDRTVLVSGGRIVAMGPRSRVRIPTGARRIDARGLTLMPGLVDMHVHLAPVPGAPGDAAHRALAVMLAHGVTTARGMAGSPNNLLVRDAVERRLLPGPRLYAAAPALNLNSAPTIQAARDAVIAARAAGYDLIKSHHLTDPAVWQAVQDEARRQRLPTAGHVTNQVGLARAMAAGQQIEHLDNMLYALLPDGAPERAIEFGQIPPPPFLVPLRGTSDGALSALARQAAVARSWHVPTLALFERIVDPATSIEALRALPEMRYVAEATLTQWAAQRDQFRAQAGFSAADAAAFRALRRRIVRALHRAGIPLMAGSDTPQAFQVSGPGLIAELQALAAAGLTPMEALRSATIVPRDYFRSLPNGGSSLGWRADFGTVEPGARADLILLRGDPSRDLANLRRLDTVIAAGQVYDRTRLDAMLDEASRAAKGVD